MSVFIRPFRKEDLAFVPIEPLASDEVYDTEFAQAIEDSGLAVTGIRNGKIAGCGGVHPIDEIHGEIWLRLDKDCLNHKIDTLRWIKSGMKIIEEIYPFKQLNATIQSCFDSSIKLVERLGFGRTQEITDNGKKWLIYSKRIK